MTSSHFSDCKLVSITPNAEEQLVFFARVSNPKGQDNKDTAPKLIKYLITHKHWSPFQLADMTIEINTTRAISAQILRHRAFTFQEFSQRYADVGLLGAPIVPHLRAQDFKNRQNSTDDLAERLGAEKLSSFYRRISNLFEESEHLYGEMVSVGVAKECARSILPLASRTRLYMHGSVRDWIHYLQVRSGVETQLEHREIALAILEIFKQQLPNTYEAAFGS